MERIRVNEKENVWEFEKKEGGNKDLYDALVANKVDTQRRPLNDGRVGNLLAFWLS